MYIQISVNKDLKKAISKWKDVKKIKQNIFLSLLTSLKKVSADSKANYLSGPRPRKLGVRSGRLRGIQSYSVGPWKGNVLEGKVGYGVGTFATRQINYDWIHEKGFHGLESVKAYTRMQTHIFGVPVAPFPVRIPAHTRMMNMPARPYLSPPFAKEYVVMRRRILSAITRSVK